MPTSSSTEKCENEKVVLRPTEEYLKIVLNEAAKKGILFEGAKDGEETPNGKNCIVESVELEGSGALGENYGSSMTFANVKVKTEGGVKEIGIVIKCLKKTPWHVEIMNIFVLFEKEVEFFNKTLPATARFQLKRGVSRPITDILPRCLYASTENEEGMVITENICPQGFKMAERRRGLGFTHSILALQALGRFHAASLTMKILEPDVFREVTKVAKRESYFTEERRIIYDRLYEQISKGKLISLAHAEAAKGAADADLLLKMAEVGEEIIRNRGQLSVNMLKMYQEPLAVFNHGDFWVNNVLYRYETNELGESTPVAAKILDFQMTRYGSPSLDVLTFLYTSTTKELRAEHEEDLLRAYHNAFIEAICDTGVDFVRDFDHERGCVNGKREQINVRDNNVPPDGHPLSFSSFKEDLRRHGPWALMIAEMMLRMVMVDSSEAADTMESTIMNGIEIEEEEKLVGLEMLKSLTTTSYDERYFNVFRELAHKGYLDIIHL